MSQAYVLSHMEAMHVSQGNACVAICYSMLQRTCVLQYAATYVPCSVLQCVAVFCIGLQCVAVCCSFFKCILSHLSRRGTRHAQHTCVAACYSDCSVCCSVCCSALQCVEWSCKCVAVRCSKSRVAQITEELVTPHNRAL